jgi:hypothetical protein
VTTAAFYCMSSEVYFLGAVGLVNSLRLTGHTEPIYLLDCGLEPAHRALLEPHVTVVDAPRDAPPYLLKTVAPLAHPAPVQVLIDVDMIATRSLAALIERAGEGRVVAVKDRLDRFVGAWADELDLGPVRRSPYVSSGLVFLGGNRGREVIELLDDRISRVDYERSYFELDLEDYPFRYLDQDVLNAVLGACLDPTEIVVLDQRAAAIPPFTRLRLLDEAALRCAYHDGVEPYVIHHFIVKPWLESIYHGIYSRLLARLLTGDDVPVRVPAEEVPLRMRRGLRAAVERGRVNVVDLTRWYARDVIPEWVGSRVAAIRGRGGGRGT